MSWRKKTGRPAERAAPGKRKRKRKRRRRRYAHPNACEQLGYLILTPPRASSSSFPFPSPPPPPPPPLLLLRLLLLLVASVCRSGFRAFVRDSSLNELTPAWKVAEVQGHFRERFVFFILFYKYRHFWGRRGRWRGGGGGRGLSRFREVFLKH